MAKAANKLRAELAAVPGRLEMPSSAAGPSLAEFQDSPVDEMVRVILNTAGKIEQAGYASRQRRTIAMLQGTILLSAPTGSGKTLMAATALDRATEELARISLRGTNGKVAWFWFAPFAGLVDQTTDQLRACCPSLRIRDLRIHRSVQGVENGDVFVATWQTVAAKDAQSRRVRTDSESKPSVDLLVAALRDDGWLIGCVVDEAHHGFRAGTQAVEFYKDVLRPDVTIMATATPRDHDVDVFCQAVGIDLRRLNRISIARPDVVTARLNKDGVRVIAFRPHQRDAAFIDPVETALTAALRHHALVRQALAEANISLVPLLLIQVEDGAEAIPQMIKLLEARGVPRAAIASHSAKEPDPHLTALAYDETKEILVFKLSVATGFDAPRAFALMSTRTNRGVEFGLQIVGRIMRVHSRLRPREDLPPILEHGTVFLITPEGQGGIVGAAKLIQAVKSEINSVTNNVAVELFDSPVEVFNDEPSDFDEADHDGGSTSAGGSAGGGLKNDFHAQPRAAAFQNANFDLILTGDPGNHTKTGKSKPVQRGSFSYSLRTDILFPNHFMTERPPANFTPMAHKVAELVAFTDNMLLSVMRRYGRVLRIDLDAFGTERTSTHEDAALSAAKIARRSQAAFEFSDLIDQRQIRRELVSRLQRELQRRGGGADEADLRRALDLILAEHPRLIAEACRRCMGEVVDLVPTDNLPPVIYSETPLPTARLNLYGIYPGDMGGWERKFAEYLEEDDSGTVLWWHRNPDRKPHSVAIVKADGHRYFPDFIVGVAGHRAPDGSNIRLVEVKERINDERNEVANRSTHKAYGSAIMVMLDEPGRRWVVVRYVEGTGTNQADREFDYPVLKSWI